MAGNWKKSPENTGIHCSCNKTDFKGMKSLDLKKIQMKCCLKWGLWLDKVGEIQSICT